MWCEARVTITTRPAQSGIVRENRVSGLKVESKKAKKARLVTNRVGLFHELFLTMILVDLLHLSIIILQADVSLALG